MRYVTTDAGVTHAVGNEGGRRMADRRSKLRAGQLVVAQTALVGVAVATTGPIWVLVGVCAAAAALLVGTFGRSGGRWWYQAVAGQRRYRRRRQHAAAQVVAAAVGPTGPPHLAWLRTLAPGLVARHVDMGGTAVGVGQDLEGWFAAAEVGSLWDDEHDHPGLAVPFAGLAELIQPAPDRQPVSTVQVVAVPAGSPARIRPAWAAVRLTPADAVAIERTGGVAAVERAVAVAAMRAARTLTRAGWPARTLEPDGLLAALVEATGMDGPPQEHWSTWRSGRLVHTCYDVTGWEPARGALAPGVSRVVVSFAAGAEAAIVATVSAEARALAPLCREVVQAVAGTGLRLRRLDGEQALAVYACAPTGIAAAHLGERPGRRAPRLPRARGASASEPHGREPDGPGPVTPSPESSLGSTATKG
jgi:hypothetical protein